MRTVLINIDVPDLKSAQKFYGEGLGFKIGRSLGSSVLELLGQGIQLYLIEKREGSLPFFSASLARNYERHWCPIHLDIVVDDIIAFRERLLKAGAIEESPIAKNIWGKIASFSDPFGHGLCLIEFIGRGYDEIAES